MAIESIPPETGRRRSGPLDINPPYHPKYSEPTYPWGKPQPAPYTPIHAPTVAPEANEHQLDNFTETAGYMPVRTERPFRKVGQKILGGIQTAAEIGASVVASAIVWSLAPKSEDNSANGIDSHVS